MVKKKHFFIDLFAGCGGLSLGLEQAGFQPVFVNEIDKDALETYLINREKKYPYLRNRFSSRNIRDLAKKKALEGLQSGFERNFNIKKGDLDLIVGGPPCQGYSGIGIRRSYSVDKKEIPSNFLYKDMYKTIRFFNPKSFIFENVRGVLNSRWTKNGKKGEIWEDILKTFHNLDNYSIQWKLLFAKDFGVPQNRPRVIMIGVRNDIIGSSKKDLLSFKKAKYPNPEELLSDLIDENYKKNYLTKKYLIEPQNNIQLELRKLNGSNKYLKKGDLLLEQEYSKHNNKVQEKFNYMIKNNGKIPKDMRTKKFSQRVLPRKWGKAGPNITATSLPDDYVHYKQPRSLTVREWARLQMFPDWYKFFGKRTTGGLRRAGNPLKGVWHREVPKYTQIGNAVPVELARRIGNRLKSVIC